MQFDFLRRLFGKGTRQPARKVRPHTTEAVSNAGHRDATHAGTQVLLEESRELLRAAGAHALAERLRVEWNPRMRSTAGIAFPGRALVRLNPLLREFGSGEIQRTLRHELAHLLAHDRAGRRRIAPHGAEWRSACRELGLADEKRTHDLPLPKHAVRRRHHYRCPSCGLALARVRPLTRGAACLRCCRAHTRGRYDSRFRFERVGPPSA